MKALYNQDMANETNARKVFGRNGLCEKVIEKLRYAHNALVEVAVEEKKMKKQVVQIEDDRLSANELVTMNIEQDLLPLVIVSTTYNNSTEDKNDVRGEFDFPTVEAAALQKFVFGRPLLNVGFSSRKSDSGLDPVSNQNNNQNDNDPFRADYQYKNTNCSKTEVLLAVMRRCGRFREMEECIRDLELLGTFAGVTLSQSGSHTDGNVNHNDNTIIPNRCYLWKSY